jgi:hypothetical protein
MRQTSHSIEDRWCIVAQSPFNNSDFKTRQEKADVIPEKRRIDIDVCLVENPDVLVSLNTNDLKDDKQTFRTVLTEVMKSSNHTEKEILGNNVRHNHQLREKLRINDPVTGENYDVGFCPLCGVATVKTDGCNYMKCSIGDRSFIPKELLPLDTELCPCEWCFVDGLPKFRSLPGREYLGFCDDKTHNSH